MNCTCCYQVVSMVAYVVVMSKEGQWPNKKMIHIFGCITLLYIPPTHWPSCAARVPCRAPQLQCSSEWWWCPPLMPPDPKDGVEEEQLAGTATLDPCGPDGPP